MSIHATVLVAATLIGASLFASSAVRAQANVCDSQAQRIQCAQQCCGGKSCAPACEADCARLRRRVQESVGGVDLQQPAEHLSEALRQPEAFGSRSEKHCAGTIVGRAAEPVATGRSFCSRVLGEDHGRRAAIGVCPAAPAKGWIDGVLGGIFALRVPLVMGVITVAALTVPTRCARSIASSRRSAPNSFFSWHWHSMLALLSLIALSLVLWQTSRQHAEDFLDDPPDDPPIHSAGRGLLVWGPRVLATLPLLGAALGIWLSRSTTVDLTEIEADIPDPLKGIVKLQNSLGGEFILGAAVCVLLAVIVFVAATMFERNLAPHGSRRARRVAIVNNWGCFRSSSWLRSSC